MPKDNSDHTKNASEPSQDSITLLKRLAGASVNKAGLTKDQSEINRKIAEVSKGSSFYENEKRKDKELTEHIAKILRRKEELLEDADIDRVEAKVDRLLDELEAERDLSQAIVHVDMDAFFANVAVLYDPDLAGKPFAVGGGGIIATASYEARRYGVRSGMAVFVGKKLCPELLVIPVDFKKISKMSTKVMLILKEYDPNVLVAGCDEAYMNITKHCEEHGKDPEDCVQEMRKKIFDSTGLTASAGIAPNMMLAKICSDKNKPNGQCKMPFERDTVMAFMRDLPVRKLPGVGRVNERVLESIGVKACGDIFPHRAVISLMDKQFGVKFLFRAYLGISSNDVHPHRREERKSIGCERTFRPIDDEEMIMEKLDHIATELEKDMQHCGWAGRTVTLKFKLDTYQVSTRARSFLRTVMKKEELFQTAKELIKLELPLRVRLLGLRVTNLVDLRAEDRGIKRYFDAGGHSPSKRQKVKHEQTEVDALPVETATVDDMMDEDAMPGFHEHEAWADDLDGTIADLAVDGEDLSLDYTSPQPFRDPTSMCDDETSLSNAKKPASKFSEGLPSHSVTSDNSASGPTKGGDKLFDYRTLRPFGDPMRLINEGHSSSSPKKPASTSQRSPSRSVTPSEVVNKSAREWLVCPICSKELETDNSGLNAHIDFCLSKSAIMDATALHNSSGKGRGKI